MGYVMHFCKNVFDTSTKVGKHESVLLFPICLFFYLNVGEGTITLVKLIPYVRNFIKHS